jgi:hypothetical protein
VTREEAHSGQIESVGTLPTPGKDATVEELKVAYRSIEASDAPEFLKDGVMMDLADRIRAHGKPKKPAPQPDGQGEDLVSLRKTRVIPAMVKDRCSPTRPV